MLFSGNGLDRPIQANSDGSSLVLTMTNYFSKYVEVAPLKDKSAVSVATGLYKVNCRQGAPVHIISDQECSNKKKEFVH